MMKTGAEKMTGGKADGKKPSDFNKKQMKMGKKVEREHSVDPDVQCEIAMDHLEEIPDYYTRLDKMEEGAKKTEKSFGGGGGAYAGRVADFYRQRAKQAPELKLKRFSGKQLGSGAKQESEDQDVDKEEGTEIAAQQLAADPRHYSDQKKIEEEDDADKSMYFVDKSLEGEGSRGGKIIGHTRTGKPIYQHGSNTMKLTPEEHHDAMQAHTKQAEWHDTGAKLASEDDSIPDDLRHKWSEEHKATSEYHRQRAKRQGAKAGVSNKSMIVVVAGQDQDKTLDGQVASIAVLSGSKILMGRRRDCGRWTLPGGHIDPGETNLEGAIRELREETGIYAQSLNYLGSEETITFTGKRYLIHSFAMTAEPKTETVNDPDHEVDGWVWVDTADGLPESVAENLHSPKNLTLRLLGLQKSMYVVTDLVKAAKGDVVAGHKYIRRYMGPDGKWVHVYHENHQPHHVMNDAEHELLKRAAELGHSHSKALVESTKDYDPQHLELLRRASDLGHEESRAHLKKMGIDRKAEKKREELEQNERERLGEEKRSNPFTAQLSDEDHAKAMTAVKTAIDTSIFGYLRTYTSSEAYTKLRDAGVTLDSVMDGVSEKKSIRGILTKLHENLKAVDTAHRGVTFANGSATSAGGYGNLGYNRAVVNLSQQHLIPQSPNHHRSQESHSVPVAEWKASWEREAQERVAAQERARVEAIRQAELERTRAAREAADAERRRAGVVAFHGTLAHHMMTLTGATDERMDIDRLDHLHKSMNKIFGRETKKEDWPYNFEHKGVKVKIYNYSLSGEGSINMELSATKDGKSVTAGWTRHWTRYEDGHVGIYNAYLATNKDFRGSGVNIGSMVNASQIKMLKDIDPVHGVIKVHANCDVGGYNWANQPFSFDSSSEREMYVNNFASFLKEKSGVQLTAEEKALFKAPCHIASFDDGKTYMKTVRDSIPLTDEQKSSGVLSDKISSRLTPEEIRSGMTYRLPCHIGKMFLLGQSWHGNMKLKDMNNEHEPYKFFQSYDQLKRKAYTALKPEFVATVDRAKASTASRAASDRAIASATASTPVVDDGFGGTRPAAGYTVPRDEAPRAATVAHHIDFATAPRRGDRDYSYVGNAVQRWMRNPTSSGRMRMTAAHWADVQHFQLNEIEWFSRVAQRHMTRDARDRLWNMLSDARRRG